MTRQRPKPRIIRVTRATDNRYQVVIQGSPAWASPVIHIILTQTEAITLFTKLRIAMDDEEQSKGTRT